MQTYAYLDNSATTPVADEVVEAMLPYFATRFGNASSLHEPGRVARSAVEDARSRVAAGMGVTPGEIVFTSGATEADNLAILGTAAALPSKRHLITTKIEHDAVLRSVESLERRGYDITLLEVDPAGRVEIGAVREALRDDTLLVSVMAGNNEIGTLQPIDQIGSLCRERGVLFHSDAVQAIGKIPVEAGAVDLLSMSAHKLHGPKGVGFLYVRKGVPIRPIVHGGGHERGIRSGTENVPGIVGMATALQMALEEREHVGARMRGFRDRLIDRVLQIPGTRLNGHRTESLPHIANFSFEAIEGESLIMKLDEHGIGASTGSACSSPTLEPSHVLVALGVPLSMAHGSLRVSTGRQTTDAEIDRLLDVLPLVVEELRSFSPFKVGEL